MKKLFSIFILSLVSLTLLGQARKPTIMVVPSDQYCISRGYKLEFESMGAKQTLPDYKAAMQNDADLRLVITKMGQIMADRGFPLKDLEMELRNLEREAAEAAMLMSSTSGSELAESPVDMLKRTAKADIIMDLSFDIKRQGPHRYISFNLRGLDAYTSKQISGAAGAGAPSSAASPELLLEEAVLSHMDGFNAGLQRHFDEMFNIGREVRVNIRRFASWFDNLETYYTYQGEELELLEHIENWFFDNTVSGRFSLSDASDNQMRFEQVRIPMMETDSRGRERAVDTRRWLSGLSRHLRDNFQIDSKIYMRGLGEAWLIVGEK
ncbi:DUF6175 family protein [Perlabentimonas gracilis]|uniref:DUF6175 family protein n=1 Tax=Perlabentimonas gracilis TaxID=2715279 RepID=UPI0014084B92|nr:DUF6175 family protein [Perlabentimonas gracilis]NHB70033.1 hypothetical protein [Perlabentimonas gracilis]